LRLCVSTDQPVRYLSTRYLFSPQGGGCPEKKKTKSLRTASSFRDALYESTEVLETMHVGAVQFVSLGRVEEGGEQEQELQSFDSTADFEFISDKISLCETDSEDLP
jgi:hypothetical protein